MQAPHSGSQPHGGVSAARPDACCTRLTGAARSRQVSDAIMQHAQMLVAAAALLIGLACVAGAATRPQSRLPKRSASVCE